MNYDVFTIEVAAQRGLVAPVRRLNARKGHKVAPMVRAASKRPAACKAVAVRHLLRSTNGPRGAHHKSVAIGKPLSGDRLRQIGSNPAHPRPVTDKPADRTVQRG